MELGITFGTVKKTVGLIMITRDLRRDPKHVLAMLEARGADLRGEVTEILADLSDLLMTENLQVHRITATPGWHHGTFVRARTDGTGREASERGVIVRAAELPPAYAERIYVDRIAGTSANWRRYVGQPAQQSTSISFAILVALAAPLAGLAGLSEGALFNVFGDSSVGKTTLARVAASIAGDPERIGHWHTSKRGVEEYAAAHNGYALVLDDIEKGDEGVAAQVKAVTHVVTGGQSKIYSATVQDRLRPLTWFCFGLSTSPKSMSALAREARSERSAGARVRLIDIPMPLGEVGGVFDRLVSEQGSIGDRARAVIAELEAGIIACHGQIFLDWRKVFLKLSSTVILERAAAFEATTPARDSIDSRLRRKFAIAYAAGSLAIEHGILGWSTAFVEEVVTAMLDAARTELQDVGEAAKKGWRALREALTDPDRIVPLDREGYIDRPIDEVLGVRSTLRGLDVVGMRGTKISGLFGGNLDAFLAPIRARNGLVRESRNDTDTVQLPINVVGRQKPIRQRIYAVRADVLAAVIEQQVGAADGQAGRT